MFKGTVTFRARIKGNGLKFHLFDFNPNEPGVDKVEVEGPDGDEILSTVHLVSVATDEDGRAIATKVNTAALNRITFFRGIVTGNARITDAQFSPMYPQPGARLIAATGHYAITGTESRAVIGIRDTTPLKAELEQASPPGEQHFGLFRSARKSVSSVEEFMHFYHILLMFFNDSQADVDAFVLGEDPTVPQTPDPRPGQKRMETAYTRLRNELGHTRPGVNLDNTKTEMANRLGGLIGLTKRAIELHP